MTRIKICGVREAETLRHCAALQVDWVGYVLFPSSPRAVTIADIARIEAAANISRDTGPRRVGLFVKPEDAALDEAVSSGLFDILQIYAAPDRIRAIRTRHDIPLWHAIGVNTTSDLPVASAADGFVIEAKPDASDTLPGGLGKTMDWRLTSNWTAPGPWLLAGGLTPENVQQAISASHASAVDVSSGVEAARGVKSLERIEKFVRNTRKGVAS